ncbi:MAG: glycine cleavage system protein GcvH [Pirellulaceae bacterium]|nr:glycine cleavage system protein GcvH [Pirellulaceae bacterium]
MKQEDLLFTQTHEWLHLSEEDGQKVATVGLTDFALKQLNDLVFVDLPETGRTLAAGESFGEIESVKSVSDIYSPVGGEIVDSNTSLSENLDRLSNDAYGDGWLIKVNVTDDSSLSEMMSFADYQKQCEEEG